LRLFLDTANLDEIREGVSWGVVSGVTTNPSLVAKEGHADFHGFIRTLAGLVPGPVNAEVVATEAEGMVREARALAALGENVVIKVPMGKEGLKATRALREEGIPVNVTLAFSPNQALLASLAGATYVSPFLGRLDDVGHDGMQVVRDTVEIFSLYGLDTYVLAASIRHPLHVTEAALAGADIATMPFKVLEQMLRHPLTDLGLERFLDDWRSLEQARPAPVGRDARRGARRS